MSDLWLRDPIRYEDGIPLFSGPDRYIRNYEKIASDHLDRAKPGADNPWIPDDLWKELEASTASLIEKHARPGERILDLGVGLGRVLGRFPQLKRHGTDISLDYLRVARDLGIDVAFAKIEDLPYQDALFDVVVCCDVLEHVFDLHLCCKQILRVLRPGGTLIIRVPNEEDLTVYTQADLPYEYIHVRRFDLAGLKLLFSRILGCDFVESLPTGLYLQGATRLRLRPLRAEDIEPLVSILPNPDERNHPLSMLRQLTAGSEEEFVTWIYRLRDDNPDLYQRVAAHLIIPIDLNVVFVKP